LEADTTITGDGELNAYGGAITKDYDYNTAGIYTTSNLALNSGTITVIGGESVASCYGIYASCASGGTLSLNGATVYANCALENSEVVKKTKIIDRGLNFGVFVEGGDIEINSGKIWAYGGQSGYYTGGILGREKVTIKGGEIYAFAGDISGDSGYNYGIGATGDLSITGGTVYAAGGKTPIRSHGIGSEGKINISNANVTALGGEAGEKSYGIGSLDDITITSSTVKTTGGKGTKDSYGIGSEKNIVIDNSKVDAASGEAPADYGVGSMLTITVKGNSEVTAYSKNNQAIGAVNGIAVTNNHQITAGDSVDAATVLKEIPTHFWGLKYVKIAPIPDTSDGNGNAGVTPPTPTPPTPTSPAPTIVPTEKPKKIDKKHITIKVKKKNTFTYSKVNGADGYKIYVQYCDKDFKSTPYRVRKASEKKTFKIKKLNGRKMKSKKNYMFYVVAYKTVDGKDVVIGNSVTAHIVGVDNEKYTNVKKVIVEKKKITLNKGKKFKIFAKTILEKKDKKQLGKGHGKKFRYVSSDKKVATVSKKGKITAVAKGTCTIYVCARNGREKKVTVTVK